MLLYRKNLGKIPVQRNSDQPFVSPGMPPLTRNSKATSFFEFWPTWLMYLPVAIQWLALSVKHRSLTLPLLANPALQLSGMVGVPKSQLLAQAHGRCAQSILPWFVYETDNRPQQAQVEAVMNAITSANFEFPVVFKPDIGCRGAGIRLIKDRHQIGNYIKAYPPGSSLMVQKLASYEPEAGVFYIRRPNETAGKIISLALKYSPYVTGDGCSTLAELINADHRAGTLSHLYIDRHRHQLNTIIPKGEHYKLVFSASHSKGAIFKNAQALITPALTAELNDILADLPEFHYGRLDIKFPDIEHLQKGKKLEIIEINTASSEPLHIWDSEAKLWPAISALLFQYRALFSIGNVNRARGYKTPGLKMLLKHWQKERALQAFYPDTE